MNTLVFSQIKDAPANIVAALAIKIFGFNNKLNGDLTIYVIGDQDVANELKKGIGKSIGKGTLKDVIVGDDIPTAKPSILFIGDASKVNGALEYTRANKILSVTGITDLVSKGVTLGIGIGDDNKPKILLNLSASVEEDLDWNPAIMKVAKTIK